MGFAMYAGLVIAAAMAAVLFFFPPSGTAAGDRQPHPVELGAPYLRIVGISYIFNAVSSVYVSMQRSAENPALGMKVFAASMLLNTFLNYCLIFGNFGAPPRHHRRRHCHAHRPDRGVSHRAGLRPALPPHPPCGPGCCCGPAGTPPELCQVRHAGALQRDHVGLGTTVMTAILGHMTDSADMLAAYTIMGNIDKFTTVSCFGLAGATAVILGKAIGEGTDKNHVYDLSWCLLLVSFLLGLGLAAALAVALAGVHSLPLSSLQPLPPNRGCCHAVRGLPHFAAPQVL